MDTRVNVPVPIDVAIYLERIPEIEWYGQEL